MNRPCAIGAAVGPGAASHTGDRAASLPRRLGQAARAAHFPPGSHAGSRPHPRCLYTVPPRTTAVRSPARRIGQGKVFYERNRCR